MNDKDMELAEEVCSAIKAIPDGKSDIDGQIEYIPDYTKPAEIISRIRNEAAQQAREEAADIVTEYLFRNGIFKTTNGRAVDAIRAAILSTDQENSKCSE